MENLNAQHKTFEDLIKQVAYRLSPAESFAHKADILQRLQQQGVVDLSFQENYDLLEKLKTSLTNWMHKEHIADYTNTCFYFAHRATGVTFINFQEAFATFISLERKLSKSLISKA